MTGKYGRLLRRIIPAALLAAAALLALAVPVVAQEAPAAPTLADAASIDQLNELWDLLATGPVFKQKCQNKLCHPTLLSADARRGKVSEIIFSHGIHMGQFDCSACHTRFPHQAGGEPEKPTMKQCFSCHGLRHGPMGIVAYDACEACHRTRREDLRPSFHTADWAAKPHVAPSLAELQTRCMMCHDGRFCDDCHVEEYVRWEPEAPATYTYDPGYSCTSCHEQPSLVRTGPSGVQSFAISGLSESAHADLSCVKCHSDFKYDDTKDASADWTVNAGLACMNCHDHESQAGAYKKSVHWAGTQKVRGLVAGNAQMANCGSCHGGHDIMSLDSQIASAALHASALEVCARCHEDYYASYNDYYHGAAYKKGTPDAPACWDCHDAHGTLPSADQSSSVSAGNLPGTCAGGLSPNMRCHRDTSEKFVANAKDLIHKKPETAENNPIKKFFRKVFKRDKG